MDRDVVACVWSCVGRRDDDAIQQVGGRYLRAFRPITLAVLAVHLARQHTIRTYVCNENGCCAFAVFDADRENGLFVLRELQIELATQGHPAYLERSRRGGHLWLFFREPLRAEQVRLWLWPWAAARGLELSPKQGGAEGIGSLIHLPFGMHRRSGKRYPFVEARDFVRTLGWKTGEE